MRSCIGPRERHAIGLLVAVAWLTSAGIAASDDTATAAAETSTSSAARAAGQACQQSTLPSAAETTASTTQLERHGSAESGADEAAAAAAVAAAAGSRSRRGAGPCIGGQRTAAAAEAASNAHDAQQDSLQPPVGNGAAAAAAAASAPGAGVGAGAAPSGRHSAAGGDGEHAAAANATAGAGGDVVIPYPGEHDSGHGGDGGSGDGKAQHGDGSGKDTKPSPSNETLHTTTTEPAAAAATTSSTASLNDAGTTGHVDAGSHNGTAPGLTVAPLSGLTSQVTTAYAPPENATSSRLASTSDSSGSGSGSSSSSSSGSDRTAEPAAVNVTTTIPPKPTKAPADEVTDPKLPPKTPPTTINSTAVPPANGTSHTPQNADHSGSAGGGSSSQPGSPQPTTMVATTAMLSSAAAGTVASTSARPTAKSTLPSVLISLRVRMSREQFCCVADEFRATMIRVMEQANVHLSKTQIRIVDIDDDSCPHDQCPQQPPESAAGDDASNDGKRMRRQRLEPRFVPADGDTPPQWPQQQHPPLPAAAADSPKPLSVADSFVVQFYLSGDAETNAANKELTKLCYDSLNNDGGRDVIAKSRSFSGLIDEVIYKSEDEYPGLESAAEQNSKQSMVVVIALAAVAGACLAALALLQMVIMRRRKGRGRSMRASQRRSAAEDGQSVQSLPASIAALRRSLRRSFRGSDSTQRSFAFVNVAMQTEKDAMSNPMSFSKLASRSLEVDYLEEEFKTIPTNLPRMSQMQHGWANKNRFANIIPLEATRVKLQANDAASDYINANFVSSYRSQSRAYIAAQSPMHNTIVDFWRMVWEQQSQVIVALTSLVEDGQPRCTDYLPDASGMDNIKVYGQFQVTAQKQLAAQDYVFCVVTLKNLDSGLIRQVVHFHYTAWPAKGVPESAARLIKFIADLRPYMEVSQGPAVVHCSTGTGRTGTLIAVDIGMQAYDDSRTIDVMNLVYRIRKERAGAVQTKEQYAFVYKALLEYAAECASSCSGSASLASGSRLSLHECQNEL